MYKKSFLYFLYDMMTLEEKVNDSGLQTAFSRKFFAKNSFDSYINFYQRLFNTKYIVTVAEQENRTIGISTFLCLYAYWQMMESNLKTVSLIAPLGAFKNIYQLLNEINITIGRYYRVTMKSEKAKQQFIFNTNNIINLYSLNSYDLLILSKSSLVIFDSMNKDNLSKLTSFIRSQLERNNETLINFSLPVPELKSETKINFIKL